MSFTFVTVLRSGGVYTPQWVDRIEAQAWRHLRPTLTICVSDLPAQGYRPLEHEWPGWFSKIELFRPAQFAGLVVYMDLDTLICGPIPDIEAKLTAALQAGPPLALLDDFYQPTRPASGVMAWIPCAATERIYHEFAANPVIRSGWQHGDGSIIGQHPHQRLQSLLPGVFASYKAHKLDKTNAGFPVVCFHGTPKQNDLPPDSWARRAWVGRAS